MRDSEKNKTKIFYALRNVSVGEDEWGNTKDITTYSSPQELKISISANKGEVAQQAFGADLQYDREMVTHDMSCPIDEYSRLWIGEGDSPELTTANVVRGVGNTIVIDTRYIGSEPEGNAVELNFKSAPFEKPHNYEVVAVSKSLNCIRYAIRRVNVSR